MRSLPPYVTQPIQRPPGDDADDDAAQAPARPASFLGATLRAVGSTLSAGVEAYARSVASGPKRAQAGAKAKTPPCTPCAARALVAQARQAARGGR